MHDVIEEVLLDGDAVVEGQVADVDGPGSNTNLLIHKAYGLV